MSVCLCMCVYVSIYILFMPQLKADTVVRQELKVKNENILVEKYVELPDT